MIAVSLLFLLGLLCPFLSAQGTVPSVPICSTLSGFSSGPPFGFTVSSGVSERDTTAALVLTAFSGSGEESHQPISMAISYEDPPGVSWNEKSTNVIVLPFVLSNMSIHVELQPTSNALGTTNTSTNTPSLNPFSFSFLSYTANHPSCFIPLSPDVLFRASILNFREASNPDNLVHAFSYFSTSIPSAYNSVVLTIRGDPTPSASIFVIPNPTGSGYSDSAMGVSVDADGRTWQDSTWLMYKSGDAIPGSGKMYFVYTPNLPYNAENKRELCELEIRVRFLYTTNTAAPITSNSPESNHQQVQKKTSWFHFSFFKFVCIVFIVGYLLAAYRNYAILGEHQCPFMFPFTERISLFLSTFGLFGIRRPEYHNLDERI